MKDPKVMVTVTRVDDLGLLELQSKTMTIQTDAALLPDGLAAWVRRTVEAMVKEPDPETVKLGL